VQLLFEGVGHFCQRLVSRTDILVPAKDPAPIARLARLDGVLGMVHRDARTVERKIESPDLGMLVTLHVTMVRLGLVHLFDVLDVVFLESSLLGKQLSQKRFHLGDFRLAAFMGQPVLERRDELHREVRIP